MSAPSLLVRADGGPGIGAGHLGRCLALVQAWVDWGGTATLLSSSLPAEWADRYRREGVAVAEPGGAPPEQADWAVLDGYRFGPADEELVRKSARRLLAIDDHGTGGDHGADLALDQNLGADATPYSCEALLGPRYALLRRDFRPRHGSGRAVPDRARRLLVALGGSPPAGFVALVGEALRHPVLGGLEVTVLDGVDDVAPVMAGADLALSASGSICWELCCSGLPAVLVPAAPNQEPVAAAMDAHGAAANAGLPPDLTPAALAGTVAALAADPGRRASMARRGPALVDGRGARRVATRMRADLLDLRPVREGDARLLWEWANDPAVRASAFDGRPIAWESHVEWLGRRLSDPGVRMYLAAGAGGEPLGQVRFEPAGEAAEIDVSLAPDRRGRGWGGPLIDAGTRRLFADTAVRTVVARVKEGNAASRSALDDADFHRAADRAADRAAGGDDRADTAGATRHLRHRADRA